MCEIMGKIVLGLDIGSAYTSVAHGILDVGAPVVGIS